MEFIDIAIIGLGVRGTLLINTIKNLDLNVRLKAIVDTKELSELRKTLITMNIDYEKVEIYKTVEELIKNCKDIDGIIISTRCSLHTTMVLKVIELGIPLLLEKPVSINIEDLKKLNQLDEKKKKNVVMSFPLKFTPIIKQIKQIVDNGEIGIIEHISAINYVTYGGVYYHSWYRDEQETGGLFLQKATHDIDYINYICGYKPFEICAMKSKRVMCGNMPSGILCVDCAKREICNEGPFVSKHIAKKEIYGPSCCFAVDTGNEDSGSLIINYDTGMHMVYTQNFFVRNKDSAKRGAIFAGTLGTIEFDFYKSEIIICENYSQVTKTIKIESDGIHSGGDFGVCCNFINLIRGIEKSKATLQDGINSCLICLKAKESSLTKEFKKIEI